MGKPITIELEGHKYRRIVIKTRNSKAIKKELGNLMGS